MRRTPSPALHIEHSLWQQGIRHVGGIDEAGRGAWAGPVAAAVVVLPDDPRLADRLQGVRDSKQMTARQRERWAMEIRSVALAWSVGMCSAAEIDSSGILPATRMAVMRAMQTLPLLPDYLLLDYIHWPGLANPHLMMPKGESQSLSIAAASVLAKTARDALMRELDGEYSGYGFARHKGYGTAFHQQALRTLGLSPVHRKSYRIM